MKLLFTLITVTLFHLSWSQSSLSSNDDHETQVFQYFQEKQFEKTISILDEKESLLLNEEIILGLSKLKLGKGNVPSLERLIRNSPESRLASLSYFYLAEHYFFEGDSTKGSYYIEKTEPLKLSKNDQSNYGFIAGIHSLASRNYKKAKNLFAKSQKAGFEDELKLTYYIAYANYYLGDIENALKGFETSVKNADFSVSSQFFIAKINLDQGKYEEVINLAQSELSEEESVINSGFYQLIGEAYAKKNSVAKADAYFDKAIQLHPARPTSALYYQAGVSKFKIGNSTKAINYLTEAGIGSGEFAHLSAFQLGRLYLQRKDFAKALVAYTESSVSEDLLIKEESLYQVSKLHAQLGEFNEALNYSDDYLKKFKTGKWVSEIQNLIAETYLRTSNYDLAIAHLEKLGISGQEQQAVYQKVTFQKGQLMFNDALFDESISWFRKSSKYSIDRILTNEAHFYIGEAYMAQENYQKAIQSYAKQSSPTSMTFYGIGYAYYNLGDYSRSVEPFQRFIQLSSGEIKIDGQVRLADCLYALKRYADALEIYQSINQRESSYIQYQIGLVQIELGNTEEAIRALNRVMSSSRWKDDAVYSIASLQFKKGNFPEAVERYTRLIENNSNSRFLSKSLLNRALCFSNMNELQKSKNDFENILDNHLTSEEALSAILGLQGLQQKGVSTNKLENRIAEYKKANPNDTSLEVIEFEAAKGLYFDLSYIESIQSLKQFIKDYSKSSYILEAKYYLGDAYYRLNQLDNAIDIFRSLKAYQNNFTGRVLSRLGEINYQVKKYEESIDAYNQLLVLALSPKDSYNARLGLTKAYFESNDFSKTIEMTHEILTADWIPLNAEPLAILYKARSLRELNSLALAKIEFEKISTGTDVISAEANYQLALIDSNNQEYEKSLNKLFDLNSKYGSYAYWIDQSYLLIADNYLNTNQLFQAKATLRSIIEHSQDDKAIREANRKLKEIEQDNHSTDSTKVNRN